MCRFTLLCYIANTKFNFYREIYKQVLNGKFLLIFLPQTPTYSLYSSQFIVNNLLLFEVSSATNQIQKERNEDNSWEYKWKSLKVLKPSEAKIVVVCSFRIAHRLLFLYFLQNFVVFSLVCICICWLWFVFQKILTFTIQDK